MVAVTICGFSDEAVALPEGRLRLGSALAELSRENGLTNADVEALLRSMAIRQSALPTSTLRNDPGYCTFIQ